MNAHRELLSQLSIAVLFGGRSGERDVSIAGARTVIEALEQTGYAPKVIDTGEDRWWQKLDGVELAFNMQHGAGGEDGVTQGLLESLGIVGTGSGVLGSALAMDKLRCKRLWLAMGLPTADFEVVATPDEVEALVELWGALFLKPAREGSSLGMSRVDSNSDPAAALELALAHDATVIAERFVDGPEYTVAVLGERCLPPIRVQAASLFYDYEAKYHSDATRYHIPCGLNERDERELCELVLHAFDAVQGEIWGRVDLIRDSDDMFQLLEVNTVPGMTDHSLVPMAARAAGLSLPELVEEILWRSWTRTRGAEVSR
ncbi:MAG: D-alanine--D-alanine ligase [Halieaceae bacterium]|nr:D-alanine--D-alanine ligase [Halieaceae bacterium]